MAYYSVNRLVRLRRAVEEVTYFLSQEPLEDVASTVKTSDSSWQKHCLMLHPGRDFDFIIHWIDTYIAIYPDHINLRCARALLLFGISYFAAAREDLYHALYIQPTYIEAQLLLGESWYLSGQLDRAFKVVSHVLKNNPSHVRANMVRVAICQSLARRSNNKESQDMYYNLALSDLDLLLKIFPTVEIKKMRQSVAEKLSQDT